MVRFNKIEINFVNLFFCKQIFLFQMKLFTALSVGAASAYKPGGCNDDVYVGQSKVIESFLFVKDPCKN